MKGFTPQNTSFMRIGSVLDGNGIHLFCPKRPLSAYFEIGRTKEELWEKIQQMFGHSNFQFIQDETYIGPFKKRFDVYDITPTNARTASDQSSNPPQGPNQMGREQAG